MQEIGMGGTIKKYTSQGHDVKMLTAIIPHEYVNGEIDLDFKQRRLKESKNAAKILGASLQSLDLDPYSFTANRELTKQFDKIIRDYKPDRLFTCWEHDSHQDHHTMSQIIVSCSRKNNFSVYQYEVMLPGGITSQAFNPQLFIDISDFIESKKSSITTYKSVFDENPNQVDSILARSKYRGGQINVKYAEAFEIVKEIEM